MLKRPTVAVDEQRVVLIMPVGAILTVTSDTSFEKRMIEVSWGDRKLAMFGTDLTERGEENFATEATAEASAFTAHQEMRHLLEDDFDVAQQRRIAASKRYAEIMSDIPNGTPQTDGADRIRQASGEYRASREAATEAMRRLSNFLIRGTVPPELERKPAASETYDESANEFGQG
jgi:hypothetical protein